MTIMGRLITAVVLSWMGLLVGVPVVAIMGRAIATGPSSILSALVSPPAVDALGRTVAVVAIVVVLNGVFGIAAGLVLARHRFPGKWILDALVDLPLAVSPVMVGLGYLLVVGRGGILDPILRPLDVQVAFAFSGLVLATAFVTVPYVVREVALVLNEIGTDEDEAAATLGASPWATFIRVTLPSLRHALTCGLTLTVARSLGEFGAVLVLGGAIAGRTHTATTFVYSAMEERHDAGVFGMAMTLALCSLGMLAILELARSRKEP
jgi:sulfate transport system permease protein